MAELTPVERVAAELERLSAEWAAQASNAGTLGSAGENGRADAFQASARRVRHVIAPAWEALTAERDALRRQLGADGLPEDWTAMLIQRDEARDRLATCRAALGQILATRTADTLARTLAREALEATTP